MTAIITAPKNDGMFSQSLAQWWRESTRDLAGSSFGLGKPNTNQLETALTAIFPSSMEDEEIVDLISTERGIMYAAILMTAGGSVNLAFNQELDLYISCRRTNAAQRFRITPNLTVVDNRIAYLTPTFGSNNQELSGVVIPCPAGVRVFLQADGNLPESTGIENLYFAMWMAQVAS